MSISARVGTTGTEARTAQQGRSLLAATLVAGAAFIAEAITSVVIDSHVGYHALNAVLNAALLGAGTGFALAGRAAVGRSGVGGGWVTGSMALLALVGGIWAVAVEGLTSAESPSVVEGITHTAVLASLLALVALGWGLRRVQRVAGSVIAGSSACLVIMVLAGFDQPEAFLAPEVVLGLGWLMLSRSLPVTPESARR